jgi:hypothetical protein
LPELPKPPLPRALASKLSTTLKRACTTGTITICAMRSIGSMTKLPALSCAGGLRFQHDTISGP